MVAEVSLSGRSRGPRPRPERFRVVLRGVVQGVGFRPFVERTARALGLAGCTRNTDAGLLVEVEGAADAVERFIESLEDAPSAARVDEIFGLRLRPLGERGFRIEDSTVDDAPSARPTPDLVVCASCRREVLDPRDRRHDHAFASCTECGPRYSIIRSMPWDRARTTQAPLPWCPRCRSEYDDPSDRRRHAQPIACGDCGPRLRAVSVAADGSPSVGAADGPVLDRAAAVLVAGGVVAVKGLGGYQLVADARSEAAVRRLRETKRRPEKPFAVMVADLDAAERLVLLDAEDRAALVSGEGPIVLAPRRARGEVAPAVAPGSARLGVFIATTSLHVCLLRRVGRALVVTSGNVSGEPIITDDERAMRRLAAHVDLVVAHDRAIARGVDDGVRQRLGARHQTLRVGRGRAPLAVALPRGTQDGLALGAYLDGALAFARRGQAILGQHLGDLDHPAAREGWRSALRDGLRLFGVEPRFVAYDPHPDYPNVALARELLPADVEWIPVWHHHAHVAACLLEHGVWSDEATLGVAFDGSGMGADRGAWGGELLVCRGARARRVGRLRPFPLPGGDAAAREPARSARGVLLGALGEGFLDDPALRESVGIDDSQLAAHRSILRRRIRCVETSSAGRLFDAVSCLLTGRLRASFEGQAAIELEELVEPGCSERAPFVVRRSADLLEIDWRPAVAAIVDERRRGLPASVSAARFHNGLAAAVVECAERIGLPRVALAGGCFANRPLVRGVEAGLAASGVAPWVPRSAPPGDGGIAWGQLAVAVDRPRGVADGGGH